MDEADQPHAVIAVLIAMADGLVITMALRRHAAGRGAKCFGYTGSQGVPGATLSADMENAAFLLRGAELETLARPMLPGVVDIRIIAIGSFARL